AVMGFFTGPPIMRTGAQVDGGLNCTVCHRSFPVNSGPGRVTIRANAYNPGQKQNITIEIRDPNALRWGFQITARLASDETKQAGTFTSDDNIRVRCAPTGDAPCTGRLEFASHRAASTRAGSGGPSQTFVLEWTPPSNDLGDVVFYAAGNASNNSNSPIGDYIYTTSFRASSAGCGLTTKPGFRTGLPPVVNAASFLGGVTSNALLSIYGGPFAAPAARFQLTRNDLIDGKWPTDYGCVRVEIGGKRAPIFYIQADQINVQAPILEGSGPVPVVVTLNPGGADELRSDPISVPQSEYQPALFTFNGTSVAARNSSRDNAILADPAVVTGGVFARPGDILILYGTGFG
ncbi:MAG: choice-of-anchor V domain-containing protein, partial [Bryobacteraceae bacterium]